MGKKIVFTNGIFDILHKGHIELLKYAKSLGDILIVGINTDKAVKLLKGPDRPINNELDRKRVLEALREVDQVIIFDDTESTDTINSLKPHIVVKGGEWTAAEVRQRDKISEEIEVKTFPIVKDYSTTSTIRKIHEREKWMKEQEKN